MMATEKALGISFEMAEIGEIGEIVEMAPFICPFAGARKPKILRNLFAEISIINKMCPRKDYNFFPV